MTVCVVPTVKVAAVTSPPANVTNVFLDGTGTSVSTSVVTVLMAGVTRVPANVRGNVYNHSQDQGTMGRSVTWSVLRIAKTKYVIRILDAVRVNV